MKKETLFILLLDLFFVVSVIPVAHSVIFLEYTVATSCISTVYIYLHCVNIYILYTTVYCIFIYARTNENYSCEHRNKLLIFFSTPILQPNIVQLTIS